MTREISNSEDILDSRDIIARVAELESDLETWKEDQRPTNGTQDNCADCGVMPGEPHKEECTGGLHDAVREEDFDEWDELQALKQLAEQGESSRDWRYGETLIRDSYFEEYAQQLAEDIGAIDRNANWPLGHIDWEAAAEALKQDYMEVDFSGVTYYIWA